MPVTAETLSFLTALNANNHREWFQEHRLEYQKSTDNFKEIVACFIKEMSGLDPFIREDISATKCLFRIYRDIRFSKDKTPYKTWLSAGISMEPKKLSGPEYYIHVGAEEAYLAVGYWRPEKNNLAAIRQEIDYSGTRFNDMVMAKSFQAYFKLEQDDVLKKIPVGYSADHPAISFLKLKSFVAVCPFSTKELTASNFEKKLTDVAKIALPFKWFIHEAIAS